MTLMPAAFFGHGNPMNALENNRYTAGLAGLRESVPRPRAILVVSAHWYINATAVTAMPRRARSTTSTASRRELFDVHYPAPGLPELAEEVADIVHPTWVGADLDSWGIDHGTWSVLMHAFPDADIPVVQLSINALKPLRLPPAARRGAGPAARGRRARHRQRQRRAQPRRREPGAARHRLRLGAALRRGRQGADADDPTEVAARRAPRLRPRRADPRHFIPLLYVAGVAGATSAPADVLVDGYAYGSLSMTAYTVGMDPPAGPARLRCPAAGGPAGGRRQHLRHTRSRGNETLFGGQPAAADPRVAHEDPRRRSGCPSVRRWPGGTQSGSAGFPPGNQGSRRPTVVGVSCRPSEGRHPGEPLRPAAAPRAGRPVRSARRNVRAAADRDVDGWTSGEGGRCGDAPAVAVSVPSSPSSPSAKVASAAPQTRRPSGAVTISVPCPSCS